MMQREPVCNQTLWEILVRIPPIVRWVLFFVRAVLKQKQIAPRYFNKDTPKERLHKHQRAVVSAANLNILFPLDLHLQRFLVATASTSATYTPLDTPS